MENIDDIFNEFAHAFIGKLKDDKEIAFPAALDRQQLNGTVSSLHEVDRYLTYLHQHRERIQEEEGRITLLRAGAYLGEVIRHAAPEGEFHWVDYNEYISLNPDMRKLIPERNAATCAFLVRCPGAMNMPLNKISRFIAEGPEHSVHYFASCVLQDWPTGESSAS